MGRINGDLLDRTFDFAVALLDLVESLPQNNKGWVLGKQVLRSGTSVGANLREADFASSEVDFAHKCNIALKESSETEYWLLLCRRAGLLQGTAVNELISEANELTRILVTILKRTRKHVDETARTMK